MFHNNCFIVVCVKGTLRLKAAKKNLGIFSSLLLLLFVVQNVERIYLLIKRPPFNLLKFIFCVFQYFLCVYL